MAEKGEETELAFVPETVLKKRKNNEEWAIKRKAQQDARKKKQKDAANAKIKRPEDFVWEFRTKELDLVRMKNRIKTRRSHLTVPESKLIFVIRLYGSNDMHPKTRKILMNMKLNRPFTGVFVKADASILNKLLRVEPFVTYGCPNLKNVRDLVLKKGCGRVNKQNTPLTDNTVVEQALGKHGIICIEDIVHEITSVGPHFKELTRFLLPFKLKKPDEGVLKKSKYRFKDGGDIGNREDLINDLISKMN